MQRNARTIARAQSFRDDEQNRRREELQRRIEETRKKLQNVSGGYIIATVRPGSFKMFLFPFF